MAKLFQLFGITYLVGKIKFKLLFQGPLAKWVDDRRFFQRHKLDKRVIIDQNQTLGITETENGSIEAKYHPHTIHGTGIFTYTFGWFLW